MRVLTLESGPAVNLGDSRFSGRHKGKSPEILLNTHLLGRISNNNVASQTHIFDGYDFRLLRETPVFDPSGAKLNVIEDGSPLAILCGRALFDGKVALQKFSAKSEDAPIDGLRGAFQVTAAADDLLSKVGREMQDTADRASIFNIELPKFRNLLLEIGLHILRHSDQEKPDELVIKEMSKALLRQSDVHGGDRRDAWLQSVTTFTTNFNRIFAGDLEKAQIIKSHLAEAIDSRKSILRSRGKDPTAKNYAELQRWYATE